LLDNMDEQTQKYLIEKAHAVRTEVYEDRVFMRGLIEFTNYCKQNCTYCGIRADNLKANRYRLTLNEMLNACETGYRLGYRTFVLQGGEDDAFTDEKMVQIIQSIKQLFPDCAITLSIGEKPRASYQRYYDAGADRYLLRHETASKTLYEKLHPNMRFENRIRCLYDLKEIGYQVGAGFMVGLPEQTNADFIEDFLFLQALQPQMVGIGPFIPHQDTALANAKGGTVDDTVTMIAIVRLILPNALLPATTALGSIDPLGREKGLKAGANVVMPNLSPTEVRAKYALYDGKICTGDEAAECRNCIERRINQAGFSVDLSRGDHAQWRERNV
ncbi:MAG: [FeFe] hydrogenase H-cluster radical SAM maturase HydE, partial [Hyphomonadaceae bacterium]|nr:[FeFe] hydrogenase H-cluster radical SAM maturase HydE [Clostridia bacterium]